MLLLRSWGNPAVAKPFFGELSYLLSVISTVFSSFLQLPRRNSTRQLCSHTKTLRGGALLVMCPQRVQMRLVSSVFVTTAFTALYLRSVLLTAERHSPLRRCGAGTFSKGTRYTWSHNLTSPRRFSSESAIPSSIFVRFQPTPNDACYKFYVDEMTFLPPGKQTMMFDNTNSYQSPLAHRLLEALPMVEEVTVGTSFVTVRRVEEADAKAAARLFAMKFHGVQDGQETDESATAAGSQALQQNMENVREEGGDGVTRWATQTPPFSSASSSATTSPPSRFAAEAPIELGGFTVSPSAQDEQIDESVIEALITATDWSELKFHVSALLTDHISSGSPHVDPNATNPHADTVPEEGDSEVVLMIKELVATTIRPQLQDDGGDLRFVSFDAASGEMQVELLGACRSCKSSKTTLVDLIERTTRHWIPEVKGVKDVSQSVSLYQFYAEGAAAEAESSVPVTELLQHTRVSQGGRELNAETSQTVHFTSSSFHSAGTSHTTAHRIVREVRASVDECADGKRAPAPANATALKS